MNKIAALTLPLILVSFLLCAGCVGNDTPQGQPTGVWNLAEDTTVQITIDGTNLTGKAQVNSFFGNVSQENGKTIFSVLGMTKMTGPTDRMNAESAFFAHMKEVNSYTIDKDTLYLKDATGKTILKFIRDTNQKLKGTWNLEEDTTVQITIDGTNLTGKAQVNSFFGNVSQENGKTIFSVLGMTKMTGPTDKMKAESAFFEQLKDVNSYAIDEDMLYLKDTTGKTILKFIRDTNQKLKGTWNLETDTTVQITIDGTNLTGTAQVNSFFGNVSQDNDKIDFSVVATTLMSDSEEKMNAETTFFAHLKEVNSYTIDEDTLYLKDATGKTILKFIRDTNQN